MSVEHERLLRTADEGFHVVGGDPFYTEGSWWCFFHPERRLAGWVYHLTRLNLGVASGGVWVWDDTATQWYEAPYFALQHLQPVRPGAEFQDMEWADGTRIRSIEPFLRYEVRYHDAGAIDLELQYQALMAPYVSAAGEPPAVYRYEQPSHVTGQLVLHGEKIDIDCFAIFDHSWGSRPERPIAGSAVIADVATLANRPAPYLWGTASSDDAFFVMSGGGQLVAGGQRADLVSVGQDIQRNPEDGTIRSIRVTGTDTLGRPLDAFGTPQNLLIRPSAGASVGFIYTIDWQLNGRPAPGDVQDVWPAAAWSVYRRGVAG